MAYGSDDSSAIKTSDPYVVDDRGLWFDGRKTFATLEGLVLNQSYTYTMWVKPHGDGSLATVASKESDGYYVFGLAAFRARYADNFNRFVWNTSVEIVENSVWQNLALAVGWTGATSDIKVYKNGLFVDGTTSPYVTVDRPDYAHHHLLGANEVGNALFDYYTGYMYALRVSNTAVSVFDDYVLTGSSCGIDCDACISSGTCLGACGSN
jgi:hypothetical protein